MASELEKLERRLRACQAAYAKPAGGRSDSFKRTAIRQALGAVVEFIRAQPGWRGLDELLSKMEDALDNVENGHVPSWLDNTPPHRAPDANGIRARRAQAAAGIDLLMKGPEKLSLDRAAKKVFDKIPLKSSLFGGNRKPTRNTVKNWRYEIRAMPADSIERLVYDALTAEVSA